MPRSRASIAKAYSVDPLERRVLLSGNMLVFTAPPTTTNAGAIFDSPTGVQVTVENAGGQPIANNADSITLSLGSNPGGGTLAGTVTQSAVNGAATFSNLSITPARRRRLTSMPFPCSAACCRFHQAARRMATIWTAH